MLDRLISGAGAVTDGADRSVRLPALGSRGGFATTWPGSLLVAAVLVILAVILVVAGFEATDPTTPVSLAPADVAVARNLRDRTYATMTGSISAAYVETYADDNGNGIEDKGENGLGWYYWLVEPEARTGVTVRSTRPPAEVITFRGRGILIPDPKFITDHYPPFTEETDRAGLMVDPTAVLDATSDAVGTTVALDLAGTMPRPGTPVELAGSRTGAYLAVCTKDVDHNGACDENEQNEYEIVVFDPVTRHGIRVLVRAPPDFSNATITGLLRREERAVDDAQTTEGLRFGELDLAVSDRYILDDAAPPGSAPLAFVLALALTVLAGVILIGLAGGYLIYRRGAVRLPVPATTLMPGERIPLRITGVLRTPTGREHVREAPGELLRFVLGRPEPERAEPEPAEPQRAALEPTELKQAELQPTEPQRAEPAEPHPAEPTGAAATATTLLVERLGYPQGVALGLGEIRRISSGQVTPFQGPRPAVRVLAGTGPLFLSFDTEAERDRAAAELLHESGLGPDGKHI